MDEKNNVSVDISNNVGNVIHCPNCGKENDPQVEFCVFCGEEFNTTPTEKSETVAFAVIMEGKEREEEVSSVFETIIEEKVNYVEPLSVFAEGLPEWDVVPPQIMIRRR